MVRMEIIPLLRRLLIVKAIMGEKMRLIIEIPEEFEHDFKNDKFIDFFSRVHADIDYDGLCGTYEKETCKMFKKAFLNAEVLLTIK